MWLFHRAGKKKKIVDRSHQRALPQRLEQHWLYVLLYCCGTVAALWQHSMPGYAISLLAVVVPFSLLAYVPYRMFPDLSRIMLQLCWSGGILLWTFFRMSKGAQIDLVLIELIAGIMPLFLMGQRSRDYGYAFLGSIFMLIYGALLPRLVFLWAFVLALPLILLILYGSRCRQLAGAMEVRNPGGILRRNWHFFLLHGLLLLGIFWYIFGEMPMREATHEGLFEVSFMTEKDQMLPPDMRKWLGKPKTVAISPEAMIMRSGKNPTEMSQQGAPMNVPNAKTQSNVNGNGGASQGRDLVFQVRSPLKLYHLARLYDTYDGVKWSESPRLRRISGVASSDKLDEVTPNHIVDMVYVIEKWISQSLYAPYRPVSFTQSSQWRNTDVNFYSARLTGSAFPELPFRYAVSVKLNLPVPPGTMVPGKVGKDGKKGKPQKLNAYLERLPRQYYLTLPKKKISARLRSMGKDFRTRYPEPYQRALALRDYLRENYTYKLHADPVPADREAADFFLFELRTGHCEYFAASLAVLARLAELPARVAIGFSPGNYNTLTGMFEVYEYHAHAWTQIFIDNYGWLTFDATPPSAVPSETKPLGIGRLRDPFGDEWRVMPPEQTPQTQSMVRDSWLRAQQTREREKISRAEELLGEAALAKDKLSAKIQEAYKNKKAEERKKKSKEKFSVKNLLKNWWTSAVSSVIAAVHSVPPFWRRLCLPVIGMALAVVVMGRIGRRHWRRKRWRKIQDESLREARMVLGIDDCRAVRLALRAAQASLLLADSGRPPTSELQEFAAELVARDLELGRNFKVIAESYYVSEYGGNAAAAEAAVEAAEHIAQQVEKLNGKPI